MSYGLRALPLSALRVVGGGTSVEAGGEGARLERSCAFSGVINQTARTKGGWINPVRSSSRAPKQKKRLQKNRLQKKGLKKAASISQPPG